MSKTKRSDRPTTAPTGLEDTRVEIPERILVTLELSPMAFHQLECARLWVRATSKGDVIRSALSMFSYLAARTNEGYAFWAEKDDANKGDGGKDRFRFQISIPE